MDIYVLISLYVWITWVVTDIWWQLSIAPSEIYLLREMLKNVFNTYFPCCICYIVIESKFCVIYRYVIIVSLIV